MKNTNQQLQTLDLDQLIAILDYLGQECGNYWLEKYRVYSVNGRLAGWVIAETDDMTCERYNDDDDTREAIIGLIEDFADGDELSEAIKKYQ